MKRIILLLALFNLLIGYATEPTAVSLTEDGRINWIYYDLRYNTSMAPLQGIYISGKGEVMKLKLAVRGAYFSMDKYGVIQGTIQVPFDIDWNSDGKVRRFKENYDSFMYFYYDSDGRLEKVKDGSFNTMFRLDYDYGGQLDRIDYGGFEYFARLYYDHDDQLEAIKTDNFDIIWKIYTDYDGRLEKIKNDDYDVIVKMNYVNDRVSHVSKYQSGTEFLLGNNNFAGSNDFSPYPVNHCGTGAHMQARFYEHSGYQGDFIAFGPGDYGKIPDNWNDRISSVQVAPHMCIIIYEDAYFQGSSKTIAGNWTTVDWSDWWNDRISSFRVVYN